MIELPEIKESYFEMKVGGSVERFAVHPLSLQRALELADAEKEMTALQKKIEKAKPESIGDLSMESIRIILRMIRVCVKEYDKLMALLDNYGPNEQLYSAIMRELPSAMASSVVGDSKKNSIGESEKPSLSTVAGNRATRRKKSTTGGHLSAMR